MTDTPLDTVAAYALPGATRLRPLAALKAFRRLMADKEDTTQVFNIMRALTGRSLFRGFERMLRSPTGARQVYRAEELVHRLSDDAWLASFAPGTVGAAYRDFMRGNGFDADGLTEAATASGIAHVEHPRAWYARRLRDVHDIWHVLTGYETDALGEMCVVAFSYAQTGQLGFAAIALGGAADLRREAPDIPAFAAVREAWRNGRRAAWLPDQDYEALFAEPLDSARTRLGLVEARVYQAIPRARRRTLKAPSAMQAA